MPLIGANFAFSAHQAIQQFNWTSEDKKTKISFDVTGLLRAIDAGTMPFESIMTELDVKWAENWLTKRDLNAAHILGLTAADLAVPLLGVEMPSEESDHGKADAPYCLLIDGSHRYMRYYLDGELWIHWHFIRLPHWLPYSKIEQIA